MATKYARAVGGAWATDATWSTTSGGAADTTAPGASDDAIIDTASGAVTSITGTVLSLTVTNGAVKTTALTFSGTLTCTVSFSVTGNSLTNRVICQSTAFGTARTISAASVTLVNCDLRDITGAGAGTWSGTSVGNAQGCSGVTFTTPVTRYGVVAGSWSSTAVWSATSGGAGGVSVPLCHDAVILDANSAAGTYTMDMPRLCAGLTCTGFTRTLAAAAAEIYGSVTLGAGMTFSGGVALTLMGRGAHTLTSAGVAWPTSVLVNCATGTYTLGDAFTLSRSATNVLDLNSTGTFNDGGFAVNFTGAAGSFRQAGGTLVATGTWTFSGTTVATFWSYSSGTTTASGITIVLGTSTTARTFAGGGKTYGTLTYTVAGSTGSLTVTGANTFGTINFSDATNVRTLALPTSSGITVTTAFNVNGTAGLLMTVTGDVTKASGVVVCAYLSLSNSDASGGASFFAGRTSTDGGSNTGWLFVDYVTGTAAGSGTGGGTATGVVTVLGVLAGSGTGGGTAVGLVVVAIGPRRRAVAFRFDLLDRSLSTIGELHPILVSTPQIQASIGGNVGRTLRNVVLTRADATDLDPLADRVAPVWTDPDGVEWPLGVYRIVEASVVDRATMGREWNVGSVELTLADESITLQALNHRAVSFPRATPIEDIAVAVAGWVGIPALLVDETTATTGEPMTWLLGEASWQAIANAAATAGGMLPPHFDNAGTWRWRVAPVAETAPPDHTFAEGASIVFDGLEREVDLTGSPNVWYALNPSAVGAPVVGRYALPPSAPNSIGRVGYEIPETVESTGIGTQPLADAAARAAAFTADTEVGRASLTAIFEPVDLHALVEVDGYRYRSLGHTFQTVPGGHLNMDLARVYVESDAVGSLLAGAL